MDWDSTAGSSALCAGPGCGETTKTTVKAHSEPSAAARWVDIEAGPRAEDTESASPAVTIPCTQWVSLASNHARADFGGYRREEEKHSPFQ